MSPGVSGPLHPIAVQSYFVPLATKAHIGCLLAQHSVWNVRLAFPEVPVATFWTSCLCWVDP